MITIVFAPPSGKTEDIAQRLASFLGCPAELFDVDSLSSVQDFCRSGTAWDSYVETIPELNLAGRPVAILGLGDASSYSDYFCDAMEELHSAFQKTGARLVGAVPTAGYNFTASRSVIQGRFCGLPIDGGSEPDLTDERLRDWAVQLKREMVALLT